MHGLTELYWNQTSDQGRWKYFQVGAAEICVIISAETVTPHTMLQHVQTGFLGKLDVGR